MTWLIIYIIGLPAGFLLAANKKNTWWHMDSVGDNWGGELAVIITFLWFLFYGVMLITWTVTKLYRVFMVLLNGTIPLMNRTAEYMQRCKEPKPRKRIVASPSAVKHGGYRDAAPKPCIACGADTSIDQSGMECVESAAAQYARLDI